MHLVRLAATAALIAGLPAAAQSITGTWKIDPASAQLPSKPTTRLLKDGLYTCSSCTPPVRIPADGRMHAVTEPTVDERMVSVVDANTIRSSGRIHGKLLYENTSTVSPDGRTMTVAYNDLSGSSPVNGVDTQVRIGPKPPAGAHAISGSWREVSFTSSDNGLTLTLNDDGKAISYSDPTGISYTAPYGGPAVPVHGDPGNGTAQAARVNATTVSVTARHGGVVTDVFTMSASPDGRTLDLSQEDKRQGTVTRLKATRQ